MTRPRFLAPEVVQVSATDCGPAVLTSALRGHRIAVDTTSLRDRCHTDVDGTAVTTLQTLALEEGLDADQVVVPLDHVTRADATNLPALAVTVLPDGLTHLILVWRTLGPFAQVMDPAVGRRWVRETTLRRSLLVHREAVPAGAWRDYAASEPHLRILRGRLADLGLTDDTIAARVEAAEADPGWRGLARLDAAARAVAALAARRAAAPRDRLAALDALLSRDAPDMDLPDRLWPVLPVHGDSERVGLQGAVLVKLPAPTEAAGAAVGDAPLASAAPVSEGDDPPSRALWALARRSGPHRVGLGLGLAAAAGLAAVAEAVVLRTAVDSPGSAPIAAILGVALVTAVLAALVQVVGRGVGRSMEITLRRGLAARLPTVADRFVATRPRSDLTARAHALHRIAEVSDRVVLVALSATQALAAAVVVVTTVPRALPGVLVLLGAPLLVTLAAQPGAVERELRARTLAGTVAAALVDATDGFDALRAHRARPALTQRADSTLGSWRSATRARNRWAAATTGAARLGGLAGGFAVLAAIDAADLPPASALLAGFLAVLAALNLDAATAAVRSLPAGVATAARLLEPLHAPQEPPSASSLDPGAGVAIRVRDLDVEAGGIPVLTGVDLTVEPGQHVAVVGRSGAGKSSLLAVLLGLVEPAGGSVEVDGRPLEEVRQDLRRVTAWIDPGTSVWDRSLSANITYGQPGIDGDGVAEAADAAGLGPVVAARDGCLDAPAGRAGHHLSGGEGERLRIARSLARRDVRLVVGDEALRGLDRPARASLLDACRHRWPGATVVWATHDLAAAATFDLVAVVEDGRVVEVGRPGDLGPGSAFARLTAAEAHLTEGHWADDGWASVEVADGRVRRRSFAPVSGAAGAGSADLAGLGCDPPSAASVPTDEGSAADLVCVTHAVGSEGDPSPEVSIATADGSAAAALWRSAEAEQERVIPVRGRLRTRIAARRHRVVGITDDDRLVPAGHSGADLGEAGVDDTYLLDLPLRPGRRTEALDALGRGGDGVVHSWALVPRGRSTRRELAGAGVPVQIAVAGLLSVVAVVATTAGFAVVGRVAFGDEGWAGPWVIAGLVAAVALAGHVVVAGEAATAAGTVVRRRLLDATSRDADTGAEDPMATVLEVDALDRAAVGAGLLCTEGAIEVAVAAIVLMAAGDGVVPGLVLAVVVVAMIEAGRRILRAQTALSRLRRRISTATSEALLGHRTRLVQADPRHDEHGALSDLSSHLGAQRALDRWSTVAGAVVPGVWQVGGLALVLVTGPSSAPRLAALLGGVLLATDGLQVVGTSFREAAEGIVVARGLGPSLGSGTDPTPRAVDEAPPGSAPSTPGGAGPLVSLERATIAAGSRTDRRLVLGDVSLAVRAGDRLLVTGPSGSGKSTLVETLAGLRAPTSGERHLGDAGGDARPARVVAVPRLERNHLFTGTVAYNVLMGRGWPATAAEEDMAEDLCRAMGLGPLIDRMPSGMAQVLGEIGWRLSHGERSRLLVARALAQEPDVLLLDESFGALDAESLRSCVKAVVDRCSTVVLVTHL